MLTFAVLWACFITVTDFWSIARPLRPWRILLCSVVTIGWALLAFDLTRVVNR